MSPPEMTWCGARGDCSTMTSTYPFDGSSSSGSVWMRTNGGRELDRGEDGQPAVFVLAQPVDQRPAVHRHRVDVDSEVMVLLRRWQSPLCVEGMRLFEVTARRRLLDLGGCLRNPHRDGPR